MSPDSRSAMRATLKETEPVKLGGRGRNKAFTTPQGRKLRGLTKVLENVYSVGSLPRAKLHREHHSHGRANAGRLRGIAIDRELTSVANGKKGVTNASLNPMTRLAIEALRERGLSLVCGQRCVALLKQGVATAADLVCHNAANRSLCLVEIKCGFDGVRTIPVRSAGREMNFRLPLLRCVDNALHRHLLQLAATHLMFVTDTATVDAMHLKHGIESITATLIYVTEYDVEIVDLPSWFYGIAGNAIAVAVSR